MFIRLPLLFLVTSLSLLGQAFMGSVWSGNVSSTSAMVALRLDTSGVRVRLYVSTDPSLASPVYSPFGTTAAATGNSVKLTIQGLQPDTTYYYGVEVAGSLRSDQWSRGRLRTFPLGRGSFKIAFGSCGDFRHADQSAYDAIVRERPLLFINTGDLHYSDTNSTVADDYRQNYDGVLSNPNQGAMYRSMPVAYVWDDHDFCGNDSDTTSIGRDTARAVYRERVPSYPLAPGGSVGQAFTIGRVRVIMTDLRSASTPTTQKESTSKTRMGTAQKTWFKQELIAARDSGFPLILWVCPDPWIAPANLGDDSWGGHVTERTEIANFIRDNRITNVVLISGDMHGLAYDDGTNSDYATGGGARMVVLHGAALSAVPSMKGGPYSGGAIPGSQQYGILEVYDTGGPSVACRYLGMHSRDGAKLNYIFSASSAGSPQHALVNISTLTRVDPEADTLVSGFVISGSSSRAVLVRAVGPTLAGFGVANPLMQPELSIYEGARLVASNSGWAGSPEDVDRLTTAFDRTGAFRLIDTDSRDAALFLTLPPGPYTVQVRSGDGRPGMTLLEVYDLPP